jgi:hypothetical protein
LDYDESVEPELLNHWKRYKLRMKVTLDDKSDTLSVLSIMPSIVSEKLEASVQVDTILKLNEAFIDKSDEAIFVDPRTPALGVRAIVANTEAGIIIELTYVDLVSTRSQWHLFIFSKYS